MSKCPFKGPVSVEREDQSCSGDPQEPPENYTIFVITDDGQFVTSFEDEDHAIWLRDAINAAIEKEKADDK